MTKRGPQICTTISPATRASIDRLTREYGTIREVITRAVALLAAAEEPVQVDDYDRVQTTVPQPTIDLDDYDRIVYPE